MNGRAAVPAAPRAEIVAVGSEMLTPLRSDTNSLHITGVLNELGIEVAAKTIVGDRMDDVISVVRTALSRVDLVVMTGGLGPTDDDLTRDAVAQVLGLEMAEDAAILDRISARFKRRGLQMPEINKRQAMVPAGATALDNPNGTAPGLWIPYETPEGAKKIVVLFPGPPREMKPMLTAITPRLAERLGGEKIFRRVLSITGLTESHADTALQPLYERWRTWTPPIEETILAVYGQLELHLSIRAASEVVGQTALTRAVAEAREVLGLNVFSETLEPLERVVGDLLTKAGWRIAAGESCTGGLFTSRLTDIAGSSNYVERAIVAYSNQAKIDLLGVSDDLIKAHGAVSEPVAVAMAQGARTRAGVDIGVGITGIAGPGGGSDAKPVGTVAIAVAMPGEEPRVRTHQFAGDRMQVKFQASQYTLDWLRRLLLPQAS